MATSLHRIRKDITTFVKDLGFEEVIENYVIELLMFQSDSLSYVELMLFGKKQVGNTDQVIAVPLELAAKLLRNSWHL